MPELFKKKNKGEITVFLSLILSAVLGLILILIRGSGLEAAGLNIERAFDMALSSAFSEYDRELFKKYDLLYIDTGYRYGEGDMERLSQHISAYIGENINNSKEGGINGITLLDTKIDRYALASDKEGGAMMNQAVSYMKDYGEMEVVPLIDDKLDLVSFDGEKNREFLNEWDESLSKLHTYGDIYNPSDLVRSQSHYRYELFRKGTDITFNSVSESELPSKRRLREGNILRDDVDDPEDYFTEYLLKKLGCYTEMTPEQALSCELEYLLFGKVSDRENMNLVFDALMSQRESENKKIILSNHEMLEDVRITSESILGEERDHLKGMMSDSIVYAWAFAESAIEVNRLICGGRCPAKAEKSGWILPLDDLESFSDYLGVKEGEGLNYKEYLGIMLLKKPVRDSRLRFMDIVELNMRKLERDLFRIDRCVEHIEAESRFELSGGYERTIKRAMAF